MKSQVILLWPKSYSSTIHTYWISYRGIIKQTHVLYKLIKENLGIFFCSKSTEKLKNLITVKFLIFSCVGHFDIWLLNNQKNVFCPNWVMWKKFQLSNKRWKYKGKYFRNTIYILDLLSFQGMLSVSPDILNDEWECTKYKDLC